ncbi:hypothetical protein LTR37_020312 [Vermiconidia calcicola]|uniref:Uncharacterized protein n=1 Tax=Vermiconidia calcicola TaxID=1690605 RepID=A0ACC3MDH6_9PEZI|nr:hypothetical protein LTR37_020312 [Vermiconidia calcicola]
MDDSKMSHPEALDRIRTADNINMSPEVFEKLYLSPPNKVKGELRSTFGNPTLCGFLSSFGLTLWPSSGAISNYSTYPVKAPTAGLTNPEVYYILAFFLLCMGILSLIFMIVASRTNVVFS